MLEIRSATVLLPSQEDKTRLLQVELKPSL